jgi:glucose-1-phosphate cytidylyltransferase
MKYYAHYGHREFILCLGHQGEMIREYFRRTNPGWLDEPVSGGRGPIELHGPGVEDWKVTCVDTGLETNIGQRLKAVEPYLNGDDVFFANYADGLTNLPLPSYLDFFQRQDAIGAFACVRPPQSFHVVTLQDDKSVRSIQPASESGVWINGGFFILRREIFDYLHHREDLVEGAFPALARRGNLLAYRHPGFWACMDTFKEYQQLQSLYEQGDAPWTVWRQPRWRALAGNL